jgi:hypothetical protein
VHIFCITKKGKSSKPYRVDFSTPIIIVSHQFCFLKQNVRYHGGFANVIGSSPRAAMSVRIFSSESLIVFLFRRLRERLLSITSHPQSAHFASNTTLSKATTTTTTMMMMKRSAGSPSRNRAHKNCGYDHDDDNDKEQRIALTSKQPEVLSPQHVNGCKVLGVIFVTFLLIGFLFDAMTAPPKKVPRNNKQQQLRSAGKSNAQMPSAVAVTPTFEPNNNVNRAQPQQQQQPSIVSEEKGEEAWYTTTDDEMEDDDAANGMKDKEEDDNIIGEDDGVASQAESSKSSNNNIEMELAMPTPAAFESEQEKERDDSLDASMKDDDSKENKEDEESKDED